MPYKDKEKQRQAVRESHLRRLEQTRIKDKEKKNAARAKIKTLKEVPCTDCGIQYPYYVMDFDHVKGEKLGEVSKFITNRQYQKAFDEIDKCEVVCSNCHRERSQRRMELSDADI